MAEQPNIFGIRHLSPAGAWHLVKLLDRVKPRLVLIEGPSDLTDQMSYIVAKDTKPPIAIMAYTKETPIRTILYPFAEYSPEYQAIQWCFQHKTECRFIDLPSGTFLSIRGMSKNQDGEEASTYVYQKLDELSGEDEFETFWERNLEHSTEENSYQRAALEFGKQLRMLTEGHDYDYAEILVREAYMKYQIEKAYAEGFTSDQLVIVTGAYHVAGLTSPVPAMTEEEIKALPFIESAKTLMPYSYYRLSSRSGYGAGNKAPAYYDLLYQALKYNDISYSSFAYLSKIAAYQRSYGHMVSSAEVIEAVRLAASLAQLHESNIPTLRDLRDAAITCLGHGHFSEIALATADTEIGTAIGSLPEGISRTSIQEDFYYHLDLLRLNKYKSSIAEELHLDLREKLNVKSETAAFTDLYRSFFLHKLQILGIHFAEEQSVRQEKATWAEEWILQWTPESEIQIVEAALKGDTVELAASFVLKERVEHAVSIAEIAQVIKDAYLCGMSSSIVYATNALQSLSTDATSITEIASTARDLSIIIQYGSIRKLDPKPLIPILEQLFLRGCLLITNSCICDNNAVAQIIEAIQAFNEVSVQNDFLNQEQWLTVLQEISSRDDLNTKASGYAMAVLLERGKISNDSLGIEVQKRLSKGIPADLGASWFEGLSLKNKYALITRMSIWEKLSEYLDSLDDEEFKRALLFLRRAFADFSSREKNDIAENLGEIWNINPVVVSELLNNTITEEEQAVLDELNDFDFDDI